MFITRKYRGFGSYVLEQYCILAYLFVDHQRVCNSCSKLDALFMENIFRNVEQYGASFYKTLSTYLHWSLFNNLFIVKFLINCPSLVFERKKTPQVIRFITLNLFYSPIVLTSKHIQFNTINKYRPAISQASCRRLPAFQFDYRLTGIDDNFAGNYVKTQADFLFWNVRL